MIWFVIPLRVLMLSHLSTGRAYLHNTMLLGAAPFIPSKFVRRKNGKKIQFTGKGKQVREEARAAALKMQFAAKQIIRLRGADVRF